MKAFDLRTLEECDINGNRPTVVPHNPSTGFSLVPVSLASDGSFHMTGDQNVVPSVYHSPYYKTEADAEIIEENNLDMNSMEGVVNFIRLGVERLCGNRLDPKQNNCKFKDDLLQWKLDRRLTDFQFEDENNVKVLFAVSGAGKTRLLLETLYNHTGYYFTGCDVASDFGSRDLVTCQKACERLPNDVRRVKHYIELLVFSRAVLCNYLVEKGFKEPWLLLLAQIHPIAFFGMDVFNLIYNRLLWVECDNLSGYSGYFDLVAIDDIHNTIEYCWKVFRSYRSASSTPFFSPLVHSLRTFRKFPKFIVAGSGFDFTLLHDMQISNACGPDQLFGYTVVDSLKPLGKEQALLYARTILQDHHVDEAEIANVCAAMGSFDFCFGRASFSACFLEQYLSVRNVDECIYEFMKLFVNPNCYRSPLWLLRYDMKRDSQILHRDFNGVVLSKVLERCIGNYIMTGDGIFIPNREIAVAATRFGFGFCEYRRDMPQMLNICEGVVFDSIRDFIPPQNVTRMLGEKMGQVREPHNIEMFLEYVVAYALVATVAGVEVANSLAPSTRELRWYVLDQRVEEGYRVCYPESHCGPDIVYVHGDFAYVVNFDVDFKRRRRTHAKHTTDPNYFYWDKKENCVLKQFEAAHCDVKDILDTYTIVRVIMAVTSTIAEGDTESVLIIDKNSHPHFFNSVYPGTWAYLEHLQGKCNSE
jgi:hypothetical protein